MSTLVSLADARAKLSEYVGRAEDHHEQIIITVHGKPAAALISVYELESMRETLEILSDPETMERLNQADREIAAGDIVQDDAPGKQSRAAA